MAAAIALSRCHRRPSPGAFDGWRGRPYGNDPLPTPVEALGEPFGAFPSWFLRIECGLCGKAVMHNESHAQWRGRTLRYILVRMRHDGCGGRATRAELPTGIDGVSSHPVRRIVAAGRHETASTIASEN